MSFRTRALTSIALGLLATSPEAADIFVPEDHADPQQAIDNASPGDRIIIHGGTWTPIVIDKELTLIGDPTATFEPYPDGGFSAHPPLIDLQGPGSGRVVLSNIDTGGFVSGFWFYAYDPAIAGGGFDELWVYDGRIHAPEWTSLSGVGFGSGAIVVSVPLVGLVDSDVMGGHVFGDDCILYGGWGLAGVDAPSSTVLSLGTKIRGGFGDIICLQSAGCDRAAAGNNSGGDGVVADRLIHQDSDIAGGAGGTIYCYSTPIGNGPDGAPMVVGTEDALLTRLMDPGPLELGTGFTLSYAVSGFTNLLWIATEPTSPVPFAGFGDIYFRLPNVLAIRGAPGGSPGTKSLAVPADPSLVGLELVFQVWDSDSVFTNPIVKTIQ